MSLKGAFECKVFFLKPLNLEYRCYYYTRAKRERHTQTHIALF